MSIEIEEIGSCNLTIGILIDRLGELDPDVWVANLTNPHSYRGCYSHLAVERGQDETPVKNMIELFSDCIGKTFVGYKGGEYTMTRSTPVWVSRRRYADGFAIRWVHDNGKLELML